MNYKNNSKEFVVKKDQIDLDKDNFRTSMFIMGFLAFPLIVFAIIGFCVRLKTIGKLSPTNIAKESKQQNKLSKWIGKATSSKKRNGFTRLNQESENEESERLNKPSGSNDSETESDEIGIQLPTLSKA